MAARQPRKKSVCLHPCKLFLVDLSVHTCVHTIKWSRPHLLFGVSTSKVDEVTLLCYLSLYMSMAMPKGEVWNENWNFSGHQMTVWSFPTYFLDKGLPVELGPISKRRLFEAIFSCLCQHLCRQSLRSQLLKTYVVYVDFVFSCCRLCWIVMGKWVTMGRKN